MRTNDLGFLEDLRRTNVMLTRCKECLFVISSWDFLINGPGAHSLVGKMAANMGDESWISLQDIEEENF